MVDLKDVSAGGVQAFRARASDPNGPRRHLTPASGQPARGAESTSGLLGTLVQTLKK